MNILDSGYNILLNNKFNEEKVSTINIKNIKRKLVEKVCESQQIKNVIIKLVGNT